MINVLQHAQIIIMPIQPIMLALLAILRAQNAQGLVVQVNVNHVRLHISTTKFSNHVLKNVQMDFIVVIYHFLFIITYF